MRVAVFQNSCPTPSEIFVYNQVVALKRLGHDISLFGYRNRYCSGEFLDWFRQEVGLPIVRPWRVPNKGLLLNILVALQQLISRAPKGFLEKTINRQKFGWWAETYHLFFWACAMFRGKNFDVAHAHFAPVGGLVAMLKECGAIDWPLVVSLHGADVTSDESTAHINSGLYEWVWKHADLYTYNSSFIRDRAVQMGFPGEKMRHLPVAIGSLFEDKPGRNSLRDTKKFRILSVGRMVPKKGHLTGLRAFQVFLRACPNATYTIVGDGPLRSEIESFIEENRMQEQVKLPGARTQDQVRDLMWQSDIFLFPSETAPNGDMEGQGLVVQEAQACELPVIVTRHNGVPDGILPDESGLIYDEGDYEGMAKGMEYLFMNPDERIEMGKRGRDFVLNHYTSSKLAVKLEEIFEEARRV